MDVVWPWRYSDKPVHAAILHSPARHKCVAAARRSGKTAMMQTDAVMKAASGLKGWYIAPTYAQVRELFFEPVTEVLRDMVHTNRLEHRIDFPGGGAIWGKSAERPDLLLGRGLDFVHIDEIQSCPANLYDAVVRPMLATTGGRAFVGGTPRGTGNALHRFYELGQRGEDGWASWKLTAAQAGTIPAEEVEHARLEAERAGPTAYKLWQREWWADFLSFVGQVFVTWDPTKHVFGQQRMDWLLERRRQWDDVQAGVDFGFAEGHAGVIEVVVRYQGVRYVVDESSHYGRTVSEFWTPEARRLEREWGIETFYTDTGGGAVGVLDVEASVLPVNKYAGSVEDGVQALAGELEGGRLFVSERCQRLIDHIPSYTWEQTRDGRWHNKPRKERDDEIDALRYAIAPDLLEGMVTAA